MRKDIREKVWAAQVLEYTFPSIKKPFIAPVISYIKHKENLIIVHELCSISEHPNECVCECIVIKHAININFVWLYVGSYINF